MAVAVFTFSGLMAAAAAVAGSAVGLPVYLLAIDITIATVQLTLAWHLLVGAPALSLALVYVRENGSRPGAISPGGIWSFPAAILFLAHLVSIVNGRPAENLAALGRG